MLAGRQIGDLLDPLCVENVRGTQFFQRCLFQVINGTVVQHVAVQVGPDDLQNLFFELIPFVIQFNEVEMFTNGFQSFGKLGIK